MYNNIFFSNWINSFITILLTKGNKHCIENSLYFAFILIKKKFNVCCLFLYFEIVEKLKSVVNLKITKLPKKKSYIIKVVPNIITFSKQYKKGIRWLSKALKKQKKNPFSILCIFEFYNIIYKKTSISLLTKLDYYKYLLKFNLTKNFKF